MQSLGYKLQKDSDFNYAIDFNLVISISNHNEHFGSGSIKSHCGNEVTTISGKFDKTLFDFKVVCINTLVNSQNAVLV